MALNGVTSFIIRTARTISNYSLDLSGLLWKAGAAGRSILTRCERDTEPRLWCWMNPTAPWTLQHLCETPLVLLGLECVPMLNLSPHWALQPAACWPRWNNLSVLHHGCDGSYWTHRLWTTEELVSSESLLLLASVKAHPTSELWGWGSWLLHANEVSRRCECTLD